MTIPTAILLMGVGKISATTMVSTGKMPRDAEAAGIRATTKYDQSIKTSVGLPMVRSFSLLQIPTRREWLIKRQSHSDTVFFHYI